MDKAGPPLRIDRGVEAGDEIGTRYDPLVAKIICHANDRESAIAALNDALQTVSILGVTTNRGFLRTLLALEPFAAGKATTDLIARVWDPAGEPPIDEAWPVAAAILAQSGTTVPAVPIGFRLNAPPRMRVRI